MCSFVLLLYYRIYQSKSCINLSNFRCTFFGISINIEKRTAYRLKYIMCLKYMSVYYKLHINLALFVVIQNFHLPE